ncbi:MAG: ABC transporter permease [Candidatus Pacearchaeota archaeon]
MIVDYFNLALKNLRHRGIRSWLTLIGIFIGVAAVVSLISLGAGLRMAVISQFGISSTEVITIQAGGLNMGPPGSGVTIPLREGDVDAISRISEVEVAFGQIISTAKIEFNNRIDFVYMTSVPEGVDRDLANEINDIEIEYGRNLKESDGKKVVLGANFHDDGKFGRVVRPGDKVLIFDEEYEVVGITKKKGSFVLDNVIIINEQLLRDLIDYDDKVDVILAKVRNKDLMDRAKEKIEKVMRQRRDVDIGKEDFSVSTPEATLEMVNQILGGVQAFIIIIASISIFVGAIGIVNTMTTSVLERRGEIGIMKAIGAKNSQIFFQFLIEAGLLGLVGGALGVICGVGIGYLGIVGINNFLGSEMTPEINFLLIFGSLIGSFIIGSVSGILPAMRAANQNPVEALRG